jgi:hypothetical protein
VTASASDRPTLGEARARLRELGYLDDRVDRLLFRPVFEGRGGAFLLAILIGAFAASLAAVAAVEAAEPGFGSSPAAVAVLFLHVFLASLLPATLLGLALGWLAERARRPGASATLAGLASALLVFALWIGGTYSLDRQLSARALLWAIPIAVSALFLAAAVRLGFLARAFARSGTLPRRTIRRVFAGAAALGLLTAILLFFSRHEPVEAGAPQPAPRPHPVVVIAVDGLDLDGAGKDSTSAVLLARGATGWWPAQRSSPPEIWTTLATGASPSRHGVRALARVRPKPSPAALRPPFGTRWYLQRLGPALGLVANAPVSSADRRSLAFWEVAASAGIPSLSVGWWAAGPWPGATVVENRAVFAKATDGVDADRIAMGAFDSHVGKGYGVATVYLPGPDISREDPHRRAAAIAGVEELLSAWVERARGSEVALIVLAADSHPSRGALGRMVVFDGAPPGRTLRIQPEDAAPSILARAGVPAARDLDGAPAAALFAPGSVETVRVATYGPRIAPETASAPESDREYLEKLRSLGYLK